jgi:3-methylfumaryl-CoA hydratase
LAALLDADAGLANPGSPLPLLWHWAALSDWPAAATVGADGHPRTDVTSATRFSRRMWLGTSVEMHAPALVGDDVEIERVVGEPVEKTGAQGAFALVTVTTTVSAVAAAGVAVPVPMLTEQTRFAYRERAPAHPSPSRNLAQAPPAPLLTKTPAGDCAFTPDPVAVMRFSAVTANAHRIHYDAPYTTAIEGYPQLLVQGPLMAIALAEVVRREQPEVRWRSFECRAQRPFFLGSRGFIRTLEPPMPTEAGDEQTITLELHDAADPSTPAYLVAELLR